MKELKIRWIGQGGYLLSDGTTELCIDPYLSDVVNRVAGRGRMVAPPFSPEELTSDAVICTHNHLDHVDIDAIPQMNKDMLFLAPTDAEQTLRKCGVTRYQPFDEGATCRVGDFSLTAVYAEHSAPAIGVIVKHGERTLYFSGDTEYSERLKELAAYCVDVMVICINGRLGNMNVEEALTVAKKIGAKINVPNHYDMFESNSENPHLFADNIDGGTILEFNREYDF